MSKRLNPDQDSSFHFEGFESPKTTPVPDVLFDVLMSHLSDPELRVLLYIVRRTFGFNKDSDSISLKQMVEGITTKDGRSLDCGAGLSKASAARGIKGLIDKGVIIAQRNRSEEKGDEPTTYALQFRETPVSQTETGGLLNLRHPRVSNRDTQETVLQETEIQHSNIRNAGHDGNSLTTHNGREEASPSQDSLRTRLTTLQATSGASTTRLVKPEQLARRGEGQPVSVGESLKKRSGRPAGSSEDREILVAYLSDFAREMNDQAPLRVSVTRALNLMARSGLPRDAFLQRLYEARALVKEHSASIQTTVKRNGSPVPVKAKMAYFFAVLENLCGLKDHQDSPAPPN